MLNALDLAGLDPEDVKRHINEPILAFVANFEISVSHLGEGPDGLQGMLEYLPKEIWPLFDAAAYSSAKNFLAQRRLDPLRRMYDSEALAGHNLYECLAFLLKLSWQRGYLMCRFRNSGERLPGPASSVDVLELNELVFDRIASGGGQLSANIEVFLQRVVSAVTDVDTTTRHVEVLGSPALLSTVQPFAEDWAVECGRAMTLGMITASVELEMNEKVPDGPDASAPENDSRKRLRILYLTAAPMSDLRLDIEMREVRESVRAATHRDMVDFEMMPAATGTDLLNGLTRFRPHVVHFSGHANETVLSFDSGDAKVKSGALMKATTFAKALEAVDQRPRLVLLNACKSGAQLEALTRAVSVAVGMSDGIDDDAAIRFAARFYTAIAEGQSVVSALRLGKVELEIRGINGADLPMLKAAPGVDPATLFLFSLAQR